MFQWNKSIECIEVDADKVLHLFKSMREVQLALPGVSAQQASAYLCQYVKDDGVATVAAFHLHKSAVLAFYCCDPLVEPVSKADNMLDAGLNFVESMGFLLTDQDLHLLEVADQEMLWESLPLKAGIQEEEDQSVPAEKAQPEKVQVTTSVEEAVADLKKDVAEAKPKAKPAPKAVPAVDVAEKVQDDSDDGSENVDDLLAAVEAMRAKRPGLRARKAMPSPEEMDRRKQELRENIGRILASQ